MIWVSCEGELPVDVENIGPVKYFPRRGFPGYFFPFKNQKGYMQPIIAVRFMRPTGDYSLNNILDRATKSLAFSTPLHSWRLNQHRVQSLGSQHHSQS